MSGRALSAASWGLAFAVFFLVQRTAFAAPPTTPGNLRFSEGAASAGYLTVSGTNLVFNGQTVLLRGENFNNGPALFSGMGTINTVQHDYELAHNMGLNHVRFGLAYNWYGTTASEHANFFAMIRNHVAWAKANHLWLIPVMFAAPGDPQAHAFSMSDEYGTQDSNFWSVPANRDLLTAFWKDFAGQFAQARQIAPVIADGVRRLPALLGQFGQVALDVGRRRCGHSTERVTRARAAETISPRRSR